MCLLVLGLQGSAIERAINSGIQIVITKFDEDKYKRILVSTNPKLLISHYSFRGLKICSSLNIPIIQIIHNTYMWFNSQELNEFKAAEKNTSAYIAYSNFARNYTVKRLGVPNEKCFVIPNGIDINLLKDIDFSNDRDS